MENIRTYLIPILYSACAVFISYVLLILANVYLFTRPYLLTVVFVGVVALYLAELSFGSQRSTHYHVALHTWMVWLLLRTSLLPHYIPVVVGGGGNEHTSVPSSAIVSMGPHLVLTFILLVGLVGIAWSTTIPAIQDSRLSLQVIFLFAALLVAFMPLALGPDYVDVIGLVFTTCIFFFLSLFARTYVTNYLRYPPSMHTLVIVLHTAWVLIIPNNWWPVALIVATVQGVFYRKMMSHGQVLPRFRSESHTDSSDTSTWVQEDDQRHRNHRTRDEHSRHNHQYQKSSGWSSKPPTYQNHQPPQTLVERGEVSESDFAPVLNLTNLPPVHRPLAERPDTGVGIGWPPTVQQQPQPSSSTVGVIKRSGVVRSDVEGEGSFSFEQQSTKPRVVSADSYREDLIRQGRTAKPLGVGALKKTENG